MLTCAPPKLSFRRNLFPCTHLSLFEKIAMAKGNYYTYITTNPGKSVLYVGVTNDLKIRLQQHFENRGKDDTFAGKYFCDKLVYDEHHSDVNQAIRREKEIKDLSREKKEALVASVNPRWHFYKV